VGGFIAGLDKVKESIEGLIPNDPGRAVELCETFIAASREKIEGMDHSGGGIGEFIEGLFPTWIEARQTAKADPHETARQLAAWIDDDEYGLWRGIAERAVKALNTDGRDAFARDAGEAYAKEREKRKASSQGAEPPPVLDRLRRLADVLKLIHRERGDGASYLAIAQEMGLTPADCQVLAEIYKNRRRLEEALAWVEGGFRRQAEKTWIDGSAWGLDELKRKILKQLGRGEEALASAWKDFQAHPCAMCHEMLMEYVPRAKRAEWHGKVLEVAESADLSAAMDLLVATKEWDRLAALVRRSTPNALEALSHYRTEPAAKGLERRDAAAAARLYRALGVRILVSGKSEYYDEALEHFVRARTCYRKAGEEKEWESLVAMVLAHHGRKTSFMPDFEALVEQGEVPREPTLMERAKARRARLFRKR